MNEFRVNVSNITPPPVEPDDPVDPVDPVVPVEPEQEETTIIVPDTGQNSGHDLSVTPGVVTAVLFSTIILVVIAIKFYKKNILPHYKIHRSFPKKRLIVFSATLALISGFSAFLVAQNASQTSISVNAGGSSEQGGSISITTNDAAIDIEINSENTYAATANTVTVNTGTNYGYNLGVYASNSELIGDETVIPTVTGDSVPLSENTWGVSFSQPENQNDLTWHGMPNYADEPLLIKSTSGYQPTTAGEETTIYYGTYLTKDTPTGSYVTTINYFATAIIPPETTVVYDANGGSGEMENQTFYTVERTALSSNAFTHPTLEFGSWNTAPDGSGDAYANNAEVLGLTAGTEEITLYAQWVACGPNKICYDANGAADIDLSKQSAGSDTTLTLWASNLNRPGYGFVGWSEDEDAIAHSARIYGPNETITTGDLSMEGMTLYATWQASSGNIQDWSYCSNLSTGDTIALTDSRDNNTYAIAKLADGKCWMIENLRLGGDSEMALSTENTQSEGTLPATSNAWTIISSANTKRLNNNNLKQSNQIISNTNAALYSYGNYYTWTAAVNYNSTTFDNGGTSICPAGWGLPGDNDVETTFQALDISLGGTGQNTYDNQNASTAIRAFPNNFIYSGSHGSSSDGRGTNGFYWSRPQYVSTSDQSSAYRLSISSTSIYFGNSQKGTGGAVRCIAIDGR